MTHPQRTLGKENACPGCGEAYAYHDKERENHGGGRWSYNYMCPGENNA